MRLDSLRRRSLLLSGGVLLLAGCVPAVRDEGALPFPPPPPAPGEAMPLPPVSEAPLIWQPGSWDWAGGGYIWREGHWVPRGDHSGQWMPGFWARDGGVWHWVPAHWL